MNVVNRIVIVVLLFVIILLVAVIAIQPEESFQLGSAAFDWARQSSVAGICSACSQILMESGFSAQFGPR